MSNARTMLVIGRRELLERVKSKWFLAMTLLGPIFMAAIVILPVLLARGKTSTIEIVDRTAGGEVGKTLVHDLSELGWSASVIAPTTGEPALRARIRDGVINGFLMVPADALDGGEVVYSGDNASNQEIQARLRGAVTSAVVRQRAIEANISPDKLTRLLRRVEFATTQDTGEAEGKGSSGLASFFIGYILAFVLYMVITIYGVAVMRSVVQEKTSRVMELMVAAVRPYSLMAGKILGVGTAGLIQIVVWLGIGALLLAYQSQLLGLFGVQTTGSPLPTIAATDLLIIIVFFICGFFFYSSLYAAAGALVSSEQETQQVQMPVTMVMVIGLVCLQMVAGEPRGSSAVTLSMVPLWSSMLMPMRVVLGAVSLGQVAISLAILVISTMVVVRSAAKIYRVGVLMYGKRPSLGEVIRWLRY
ncbi:MAG: ABC transporter permease [Kofleriaceae bacterium]